MAVFNCSNCANREKDGLITSLNPSIVKNNGKEGLKLSKVRRVKWLAQIFRKDLTERNLEKTKMKKKMLSTSPSSAFSHKVQSIRLEKQIRILS